MASAIQEAGDERARVLVVDDERGPRESLRMILSPAHEVLLAQSGAEALEILRTTSVDLVTLDLNMPGMKGDEVMRTIRTEFPYTGLIVITGYGSLETATAGIRSGISDYLLKPFDVVQVSASVMRALARQQSRRRLVAFLDGLGSVLGRDRDVTEILAELDGDGMLQSQLARLLREEAVEPGRENDGERRRTLQLLEVLAETLESKDRYMRGHARRVAYYAGLVADRLCLSAQEREHVRISSFLHDLGKVGIPTDLLLRASSLTAEEQAVVRQHPEIGERLLRPLGFASGIASAIRHHHEWWNGRGYPDGLRGDEIPLVSRLIAVVDAFDAMTCDRPYRHAVAHADAVEELRRFAGVQFDASLVKEFLAIVESGSFEPSAETLAEAVAGGMR
jgi:response regulator RpfG family c-di-GMP phosphodiesterase